VAPLSGAWLKRYFRRSAKRLLPFHIHPLWVAFGSKRDHFASGCGIQKTMFQGWMRKRQKKKCSRKRIFFFSTFFSEKNLLNRAVVGGKCRGRFSCWRRGNPIFIRNNYLVHDSTMVNEIIIAYETSTPAFFQVRGSRGGWVKHVVPAGF
jgi:hypothetical protein